MGPRASSTLVNLALPHPGLGKLLGLWPVKPREKPTIPIANKCFTALPFAAR
jgi:hypothetical protein